MPVDTESLKRVLMSIKGAAKGFKKDRLSARLKPDEPPMDPSALETEPDPMDPNEPAEMAAGEAPELPMGAGMDADPDADAAAKLEAIRKLIGSV